MLNLFSETPAPNSGLQTELVNFFDSHFKDGLPEDSDRMLLEVIGPEAIRSIHSLRRARILAEAGKLPLKKFVDDLNAAVALVNSEIASYQKAADRVTELKAQVQEVEGASPLQSAQISGEIAALEKWCLNAPPLIASINGLLSVLDAVSAPLLRLSRLQDSRAQLGCRIGGWTSRHPSVAVKPPLERAKIIIAIVEQAVRQIQQLQSGHVPVAPRGEHIGTKPTLNFFNVSFPLPNDELA